MQATRDLVIKKGADLLRCFLKKTYFSQWNIGVNKDWDAAGMTDLQSEIIFFKNPTLTIAFLYFTYHSYVFVSIVDHLYWQQRYTDVVYGPIIVSSIHYMSFYSWCIV